MPPVKLNPWQRLRLLVQKHKVASIVVTLAILIALGFIIWLTISGNAQQAIPSIAPAKRKIELTPSKYYSPLSGMEVADFASAQKQVRAIMIENSPSARPQSGIKDAGIVFEAIAEGGITRFLCLYQETRPALIGPVRSLRPYYVDWLAPFDATVSHVGGSKNALDEIRNGTYKDIDQFFNAGAYWRATDRYAPHNVYTSSDKLDELNNSKGYTSSTFTGFPRKLDSPANGPNAASVNITVSSATYNVHYDYVKETNSYNRSEGGAAHVDREAGKISPKVVIAIKVPSQIGFEDGYREQMSTVGGGDAFIFQDGTVQEGTWKKNGRKDQMTFQDKSGNRISLNTGQTWITVIEPEKSVTWR